MQPMKHALRRAAVQAAALPLALLAAFAAFAAAATPLPSLVLDPAQTTVSGLSSGGFMAVQVHVAYSATFAKGAGIVAGGPFYCAQDSIVTATGPCMTHSGSTNVPTLVSTTKNWAASGAIDAVSNLAGSKVYLYSGTNDQTVVQAVMNDLQTYYASFVPAANVVYNKTVASGHAMITDDYGSACSSTQSPYINDCNVDLAGAMLQQLYGTLNARNDGTLGGTFTEFDQTAFVSGHGMAATGWVYVPADCAGGATCRLHVVFHGCHQNTADVGQQYVRNTGYNRWADTNRIVVLYPQTSDAATNSCWDWWGYDSANYAKKSGPQMAAVKAMVDRLASGTPPSNLPAPTGLGTSGATNTSMQLAWNAATGATGYDVFRGGAKVNASKVTATTYTDAGLSPGTTYSWTVKAVDTNNADGPASAPATGTTTGSAATCYTASNYAHTTAGRAHVLYGVTYANGSNQNMGLWNVFVTTTLKRTGSNYYVIGTCP
jgi:poly(3-hydroxybutyrate) depolymerase